MRLRDGETLDLDALAIAHAVAPNALTGSATVQVPFELPAGRHGFGPALSLAYSSGSSNGFWGHGWSLAGLPGISIDMSEGLPRYDEMDAFTSALAGDLVADIDTATGRQSFLDRGAHVVRRYRARFEADNIRHELWTEKGSGRVHWRTRDGANTVTIFGSRADGSSRIEDPEREGAVFQWLPELQFDQFGNAIRFDYVKEDFQGVDLTIAAEAARAERGRVLPQRYLKRVRWGNARPATAGDTEPAGQAWHFETVFDYGDHDPAAPTPSPDRAWPARPDPFSTYALGFERRTYRRCHRLHLFHRFADLGSAAVRTASYDFVFEDRQEGTRLASISQSGFRPAAGGGQTGSARPPLRFTYAEPAIADGFEAAPVETQIALPGGLDRSAFELADLYGEGLPGLLSEVGQAWQYQRNLGEGRFGPPELVVERPGRGLAGVQIVDFDGDGNTGIISYEGRRAGYYEYDRDAEAWDGFRHFESAPHLDAPIVSAQMLDLSGDGLSDLVVAEPERVTWFRSLGKEGFAPGEVLQAEAPIAEPGLLANGRQSGTLDYFFADMSGDGLSDQALVRNGIVAYWPNLGYGRFGAPVLFEDAPVFSRQGEFDSSRLLFADLTGSGTTDLIYVGSDELTYWINLAGNRFSEPTTISGLPTIDRHAQLRLLDFLGDGSQCLVWSSTTAGGAPGLFHLRLSDTERPGLLLQTDNGMGLRHKLTFGYSGEHYLRDLAEGYAWSIKLPRHMTVLDRIEQIDDIGGTRTGSTLRYHEGAYDGRERRFRGFGLVEIDEISKTEVDRIAIDGMAPSRTRIWHHVGLPDLAGEDRMWQGDVQAPLVPHARFADAILADRRTVEEALTALAGSEVRRELFALDRNGEPEAVPLTVDVTGSAVQLLQAGTTDRKPALRVVAGETLSLVYEGIADDPLTRHGAALEHDVSGQASLCLAIAYPRRAGRALDHPAQARASATLKQLDLRSAVENDLLLLGNVVAQKEYAIERPAVPPRGYYTFDDMRALAASALANVIDHDDTTPSPGDGRLISWSRTFFWNPDQTAAEPFGAFTAPVIKHHVENAAFTDGFAQREWGADGTPPRLTAAHYRSHDGLWWQPGETCRPSDAAGFFQAERLERVDGGRTAFAYDAAKLFVTEIRDPAQNRVRIEHDYLALQPRRITDQNQNVTEMLYDPLGVPIARTWQGSILDDGGQLRAYGFEPLSAFQAGLGATPPAALADPKSALQNAASRVVYDLHRWERDRQPPLAVYLTGVDLAHPGDGMAQTPAAAAVQIDYHDGFGRVIQGKSQAEPGPAITRDGAGALISEATGELRLTASAVRWRVTGHAVYNARQQAVAVSEPFFSADHGYEADAELQSVGVTTISQYDALGRLVRENLPNGTHRLAAFQPWQTTERDAIDTIEGTPYHHFRQALPATDPERIALDNALAHKATPTTLHADVEGRAVKIVQRSGDGQTRVQRLRYDSAGEVIEQIDARGISATRTTYDMLGRAVRTRSADAGETRLMLDALDRAIISWSANDERIETSFDTSDRPLAQDLILAGGGRRRVASFIYGDDSALADSAERNLNGVLWIMRDGAGETRTLRCTPAAEALEQSRQLLDQTVDQPDWRTPATVALETAVLRTQVTYDALGRAIRQANADGSELRQSYGLDGVAREIRLSTADGLVSDVRMAGDIRLNAREQREFVRLGNGVGLTTSFDPQTWRTTRMQAHRPASTGVSAADLMDISYAYDPLGNVVHALDRVQGAGGGAVITGGAASAEHIYHYDGFSQLRRANGRVHRALLVDDNRADVPNGGSVNGSRSLSLNDGAQLERYTQHYDYDLAGNMTELRHRSPARNWTTDFWVSATSNRSVMAKDANGLPATNPESSFDEAGQLKELRHIRAMTFDYRGFLTRAVIISRGGQPDDEELYWYGSDGERSRKVTRRLLAGGVLETTDVVYLNGAEIKRITRGTSAVLERKSVHVGDGWSRIATVHRWSLDASGRETGDTSRAQFVYTLSNHLGSATLSLDQQGQVVTYEEYLPFGGSALIGGDDVREVRKRTFRFAGKERDEATGLYYFGFRYFSPHLCRWISPDPAGDGDGLNRYLYVQNNPATMIDPDGLQSTEAEETQRGQVSYTHAPPPADLEAAIIAKIRGASEEQKADWRRLRDAGDLAVFRSLRTGEITIGTIAEIDALAEAELQAGVDVTVRDGRPADDEDDDSDDVDPDQDILRPPGDDIEDDDQTPPSDRNENGEGDKDQDADGNGRDPNAPDGGGLGAGDGDGKGALKESKFKGPGGGGVSKDPKARGSGDRGLGKGAGKRPGKGIGAGGKKKNGTGRGGRDDQGHGRLDGAGIQPGGQEGGHRDGSIRGSLDGSLNGTINGDPGATKPAPGRDAPSGNGEGGGPETSTPADEPNASSNSRPGGKRNGGGGQRSDSREGGERTVMDRIVRVAGWWNLEFSTKPGGQSGGIPGGMGSLNLGGGGQAAFLGLVVIDIILTVLSLGGSAGIKASLKAAFAAAKAALGRAAAAAARLFSRDTARLLWRRLLNTVNRRGRKLLGRGRKPIIADADLLIEASKGNARALAEIRAGVTHITPSQLREFLNVTTDVQRRQLQAFLRREGIQELSPRLAQLTTENLRTLFWQVAHGQKSTGDAALIVFARTTGMEVVTAERRLFNFITQTLRPTGVEIRRFFRSP